MALVLMATQPWGTLWDSSGNVQRGTLATFANPGDANPVTHYADGASASPSTNPVTADSRGRLMRWIEAGTYDQTVNGETLPVEAVSGASGGSSGVLRVAFRNSIGVWTNMPAAVTEFLGGTGYRTYTDLTGLVEARFLVSVFVVGSAGSVLRLQYSLNDGGAWADLTTNVALTASGTFKTAWTAIPAPALTDVLLRMVGEGGNAVADPQVGPLALEAR